MKILLVEDEEYIAEAIEQILMKNNFSVDLANDGEQGLYCALSDIYDIIILDIMLPKMDGLTVLHEIRDNGIKTPVLMLTARGSVKDRVKGLDSGADDYLPKPFHADELLARLRALGRRSPELDKGEILSFGDIGLNPSLLLLFCGSSEITLTLKESQLLELLIRRKKMITPKALIIEKLWEYDSVAEDSHVENQVTLLRKKLTGVGSRVKIQTLRGAGYVLAESEGKG